MSNIEARAALVRAIRAIMVDMPDGGPNGEAERQIERLSKMRNLPTEALDALSGLCESLADDTRALRLAADAFFGGDFRLPAEPEPTDDATIGTAYTSARLAAAVDEAHAALHEAEQSMDLSGASGWAAMFDIRRAHEALHCVGAGMPRVSAKKGV